MTQVYWIAQSLTDMPAADDWMAAGEAARLAGMRVPKRRNDFRLGRWTARQALAACPAVPSGAFEVRASISGAPELLIEGLPSPCALSISHSNGMAICAISPAGGRLGCDIESIGPRDDAFVETFFTPREQSLIERANPYEGALLNTVIWSAKESALKALGEGLRLDTRSVEVASSDGRPGRLWQALVILHREGQALKGWWRRYGSRVITVVASPPPEPPVELSLPGAVAK